MATRHPDIESIDPEVALSALAGKLEPFPYSPAGSERERNLHETMVKWTKYERLVDSRSARFGLTDDQVVAVRVPESDSVHIVVRKLVGERHVGSRTYKDYEIVSWLRNTDEAEATDFIRQVWSSTQELIRNSFGGEAPPAEGPDENAVDDLAGLR